MFYDYNGIGMKKAWVITLLGLGFLFVAQQTVLSRQSIKTILLASNSCNISNYYDHPDRLYSCCINQTPKDNSCNECLTPPFPTVCYPWITLTPGALNPGPQSDIALPTDTPIPSPTYLPTPIPIDCVWSDWTSCTTPCNTLTQTRVIITPAAYGGQNCNGPSSRNCNPVTQCPIDCVWGAWGTCSKECGEGIQTRSKTNAQYGGQDCTGLGQISCIIKPCTSTSTSVVNTGTAIVSFSSVISDGSQIAVKKQYLPTNTPIPQVTSTPIPTLTSPPTATPTIGKNIDEKNQGEERKNTPTPSRTPTPTPSPTGTPIPSATPGVTGTQDQDAGISSKTATGDKVVYVVDSDVVGEVKVGPYSPEASKGFLSEEQLLLAQEASKKGGILITLEQKTGDAFVTRQDELTVKRGNQLFTISNQQSKNNQSNTNITTNNAVPLLEINANNVIAQSSMGFSVDPLSGILTVETPNGPQKVSIMPDEALGIVTELKALNAKGQIEPSILLVSEKGSLIYRVSGEKVEKFLGLFPLSIQKQILISADTGSVVKVELPLLSRIMSFFTF